MYTLTGCRTEDVTTHYFKIIPGLLVVSKSLSVEFENDQNDDKLHQRTSDHWTIHFLWWFAISFSHKVSDKAR